jgi:hypothetical protein
MQFPIQTPSIVTLSRDTILAYFLYVETKALSVSPPVIAWQLLRKRITAATNTRTATELLDTVFSMLPCRIKYSVCSESKVNSLTRTSSNLTDGPWVAGE